MSNSDSLLAWLRKTLRHQHVLTVETFDRGEIIFAPGQRAERIYFLLEGTVKLSTGKASDQEISLILLPEQSIFGVLSLVQEKKERFYQAVAFTPVRLFSLTRTQWQQALQESPEFGLLMTRQLSRRLLHANKILETIRQRDLLTRLVWYLLLLADDFGIETESGILINLQLSHSALAELIGSSRPTVTHLLQSLRQEHLIGIEGHKITLYKPEILSRLFFREQQALLARASIH